VPLWFTEGMSEYLSIGFDETADMTMRDFFFNDQYVSLMDFTAYRTGNLYYYYKVGQAFFYFFETVYMVREKLANFYVTYAIVIILKRH